jgi:murein DD-endopeptidase MepM/ murein hydrolase activator NlpD
MRPRALSRAGRVRWVACALLALAAGPRADAQAPSSAPYPQLGSLGQDDLIFKQQQEQLARSYEAIQGGGTPPDMIIYSYTIRSDVDLFSLAARLNLPYETIATLNRLDRARILMSGERVLAPSVPGIFVSTVPGSDLDLLVSYRGSAEGYTVPVLVGGATRTLRFYPGTRFTPEERSLFLGMLFRFPLPSGVITSGFGLRQSPITGRMAKHNGLDIAAPLGTEVYAAREGRVAETGVDAVLGQYIVLAHEGGFSTVYGHLSARLVRLNEEVESGRIIGNVGSSGESTGPHLHFEVRSRGESRDPETLIPRGKR